MDRIDVLRDAWRDAWPQAWADGARRSDMVELYAWIHAASLLIRLRRSAALDGVPVLSPRLLADEIVRAELPHVRADGPMAPVVAGRGLPPLRVERSRPAWRLSGEAAAVPWTSGVRGLVVMAVDEGDNEVVTLVAHDAAGVAVARHPGATASVTFDDVAVPGDRLVHRADVRASLEDRLTVLGLTVDIEAAAEFVRSMPAGAPADDARLRLELCRAATHVAAGSARSASPLARQHDVSAAAVITSATTARMGLRATGDLAWHRQRLVPLV